MLNASQAASLRILLTSASFHRAYGGVAICVARLGQELAEKGVEVGLWAPDGSAKTSEVIGESSPNVICLSGPLEAALKYFSTPSIIHDNGIWLPHNHALAKVADRAMVPRIVSVHGMLEPWAMQHRKLKKWIAWQLYQRRDLNAAHWVHATADVEVESFERMNLSNEFGVIPNGTDLPISPSRGQTSSGKRTMLFLSRIHPKKGLPMLLHAWAKIAPPEWQLRIAGPDENGHQAQVEALAAKLNIGADISFLGPLNGEEVSEAYRSADAFVLPTHSENFGLVVTEALAHGLPVLTTSAAPWGELEAEQCGWSVPPTEAGIIRGLNRVFVTETNALRVMGERGRRLVENKYAWASVADQFIATYTRLVDNSKQ